MTNQPRLFDADALARNRSRARRLGTDPFLQIECIREVEERLLFIKKEFTAPAIVTGWPQLWGATWPNAKQVAVADLLDLGEGAHDLVIHGLALHWANDPVGQLIQCRRALRPDGLLIACLFGGQTLHELRAVLAEAEAAVTGGLSPRVAPMAEIRDLGGLMQRAGLALPVADSQSLTVSYEGIFPLMRDLRAMGEGNALSDRRRHPTRRAVFLEAARLYAETFPAEDGRIRATFEIVTLTGWAPDSSQQQPLRPGSAAARLSDALGTQERKLRQ